MITVECTCGQILRASPSFAGTKVTCPKCRKPVAILQPAAQPTIVDGSSTTKINEPAATPNQLNQSRVIPLAVVLLALAAAAAAVSTHFAAVDQWVRAGPIATTPSLVPTESVTPAVATNDAMPDPGPEPTSPIVLTSFSKKSPIDTPVWYDARVPVRVGNVELRIERARIGRIEVTRVIPALSGLKSRPITTTGTLREDLLAIYVAIRNQGSNQLQYRSWEATQVRMSDEQSQTVEMAKLETGVRPLGQKSQALIGPGQELGDVLVFQVPAVVPESLHLELDTQQFGSEEVARFAIRREMIGR